MNPAKTDRSTLEALTDLPNVGPAIAKDFEILGVSKPGDLIGADPLELYKSLCAATGSRHDPCVLDVFMSVAHFLSGGRAKPWWGFSEERKRRYGKV